MTPEEVYRKWNNITPVNHNTKETVRDIVDMVRGENKYGIEAIPNPQSDYWYIACGRTWSIGKGHEDGDRISYSAILSESALEPAEPLSNNNNNNYMGECYNESEQYYKVVEENEFYEIGSILEIISGKRYFPIDKFMYKISGDTTSIGREYMLSKPEVFIEVMPIRNAGVTKFLTFAEAKEETMKKYSLNA